MDVGEGMASGQLQLSAAPRETASALKVRSKLTIFKGLGPLSSHVSISVKPSACAWEPILSLEFFKAKG